MEKVFITRKENKIYLVMAFKNPNRDYYMSDYNYTSETFSTVDDAEFYCHNHNLTIVY